MMPDVGGEVPARSSLHYGHPWSGPPEGRDPLRRLRGHLVLPVTAWLAGPGDGTAPLIGLTISSVLFSPGEPAMVAGLVTPESDLAEMVGSAPGRFVVHVLGSAHRRLAQHFSGELPAPQEMLAARPSGHGPLLDAVADRALCHTVSIKAFGWSLLVEAEVDEVHVGAAGKGLAWYHGSFHVLAD